MVFDKDFKEAIAHLPAKKKDQLLLRLLKKDAKLVHKLTFELLTFESVDEKRSEMENKVNEQVLHFSAKYWSPGYLMMDMRTLSGQISEHVYVTSDKYGEVSLNLQMLIEVLLLNSKRIQNATFSRSTKFCEYVIARTFKILLLSQKMHEDHRYDFLADFQRLGQLLITNHKLKRMAYLKGLELDWLLEGDIPDNLPDLYKKSRS